MALKGFEPSTPRLRVWCSNQAELQSHENILYKNFKKLYIPSIYMKKIAIFIVFLMALNVISAITYEAEIFKDKALIEIDFGEVNNLEFRLPHDARVFETDNENYELINFDDYKLLKVVRDNNLKISYITNSVIDRSRKREFFILNNPFEQEIESLTLFLPEGAILGELVVPNPDNMLTDGKRITLIWNNFSKEEIVVDYHFVNGSSFWMYIVLIVFIAFLIFYLYNSKKFKKKIGVLKEKSKTIKKKSKERRKKDVTRNLFGEEKKIIEYLLNKKGNESWTKELVRELEISRVKLSRRLRNLEQKELIEKIPHGNENRIKLLKK